ncbi:MAG: type I glyceraldehyde-3-phosphate dehydrogenase [Candidatus ainarchaeum sp.]|nr:type I glyceraldehyde-3-phosphate dehydrogenase [Candidatus ainarchaeum sp.]
MKVAISGFGRIGKTFLRAAVAQGALGRDFDVVAINTRSKPEMHAHLFRYDSTFGRFDGAVEVREGYFIVNGHKIKWIQEKDPLKLPWKELEVDVVLESSGEFRSREDAEKHIVAGAKKVIISAPADQCDATIVPGVNDHILNKEHKLFSLASCTTNCLAPILKVMDEKFGIERGFMSTMHAYTNDQRILDGSHEDWRRARAAAVSIIPTKTGAAKAIGDVLPALKGKMDGIAFRVPVPDGSLNDIVLVVKQETDAKSVNAELKRASENELKGILGYTEEELVSHDIIGTRESAIVDSKLTRAIGNLVKISAWYDNEFGYSNRLVDFIRKLSK